MDENSVNFWLYHSIHFLNMALETDLRETLENPDGYGKQTRECGDYIEIFLIVRDQRIHTASFETNGCIYAVACANAAVHLIKEKSLEEAERVSVDDIVNYLETLPSDEVHCAQLARDALHLALADAQRRAEHGSMIH